MVSTQYMLILVIITYYHQLFSFGCWVVNTNDPGPVVFGACFLLVFDPRATRKPSESGKQDIDWKSAKAKLGKHLSILATKGVHTRLEQAPCRVTAGLLWPANCRHHSLCWQRLERSIAQADPGLASPAHSLGP